MPTINQLIRLGRQKKVIRAKTRALEGSPFKKGTCLLVKIQKPKKPNSAERKVVRVRLSTGQSVNVYVPGIGHNLQEHSTVLVRGGRTPDLIGYRYKVVRGVHNTQGVEGRKSSRSRYGTKSEKKSG